MLLHYFLIFLLCKVLLAIDVAVYVNTSTPIRTLSDPKRFLSVTLDTSVMYIFARVPELASNFSGLNFSFITPLAKALGPLYFRFGGTDADTVIFQQTSDQGLIEHNIIFTESDLDKLYDFIQSLGWTLIFDLNQVLRDGENWNSTNPAQIIDYASRKGYAMNWELGNEPDLYANNMFHFNITGAQMAEGYKTLRNILNSYSLYKNSLIMGPSIASIGGVGTHANTLMKDFLANGGGNAVNALSFHHYYMNGHTATLEDFLSVEKLDGLAGTIDNMLKLGYSPVWLGETSSAYGGGAPNLSDTYAAGFLWLDKLGLSAKLGLDLVIRQDLWAGHYSLLDAEMHPLPDYWLSLVYKKLVGDQIFDVTTNGSDKSVRLYAASSVNPYEILIYGEIISNQSYSLDFSQQFGNTNLILYLFKEGIVGNLTSKTSTLNGNLLSWSSHQPGPLVQNDNCSSGEKFLASKISQCPQGWVQEKTSPNKCIKFFNETQPFFGANFDCNTYSMNSSFLSIDSAFENSEILSKYMDTDCDKFFIGLVKNLTDWNWVDGDGVNYRNWMQGYPTNDNTQNCVSMNVKTGNWYNSDCDSPQCYICQQFLAS